MFFSVFSLIYKFRNRKELPFVIQKITVISNAIFFFFFRLSAIIFCSVNRVYTSDLTILTLNFNSSILYTHTP